MKPLGHDRAARDARRGHEQAQFERLQAAQKIVAPSEDSSAEPPLKGRLRVASFDSVKHYLEGDAYDKDNLWLRRMLVNGLAEPADDATRAMLGKKWFIDRHRVPMLVGRARQAGVPDADIPAVEQGEAHGST